MTLYWILGIIAMVLLAIVVLFNQLVHLRNNRKQAFSDVDVQMKLRYDLIPNMVEVVKGYATHEKEVLQNVAESRSKAMQAGTLHDKALAEASLTSALTGLFAVAENYPDLKANQNFLALQNELSDIENKIAAARRFFNNATKEYNTATQSFPNNLIGGMFGFHEEEFFDLGDGRADAEKPVAVSL